MLKEAIADAKAVRETAIANAKIALEEAFTPQLQSILSKKLQSEMEEEDEDEWDEEELDEELGSSEIGNGDGKEPASVANTATTDLSGIDNQSSSVGSEDENTSVVKEEFEDEEDFEDEIDMDEEEDYEDEEEMDIDDMDMDEEEEFDMDDMEDEEDLDLEAVIAELESELSEEEEEDFDFDDEEDMDDMEDDSEELEEEDEMADATGMDDVTNADDAELDTDHFDLDEDMVDLEEILREMGYGDDEEDFEDEIEEEEHEDDAEDFEAELEEAYSTIKELQSTINEVNLLNAKLLYANKLFKGYSLTNEQKSKVVENLDRTSSVREVKLVYATLAESMNFSGTEKKKARRISESLSSSRPSNSTAPKKEMITEESNELAERFKKLAGINKEIL